MVGLSTTRSKSKEKQLAINSEELDTDDSLGLKEILFEPKRIYWHTQIWIRTIAQIDYNLLARGTKQTMSIVYHRGIPFI